MGLDVIFKIAGIGIITAIINIILDKTDKKEIATLVNLASLIIVLVIVIEMLTGLFDTLKNVFYLS